MRQGTTPTHTFSIPVEAALVDSIYICYSQRGCGMLEKTKPQVTLADDEDGGQLDLPVDSPEEMLTDRLTLRQLMEELDPKDRELLILRYFREKTQVETAALLGMTQVQVSRREKKLLTQMREKMI